MPAGYSLSQVSAQDGQLERIRIKITISTGTGPTGGSGTGGGRTGGGPARGAPTGGTPIGAGLASSVRRTLRRIPRLRQLIWPSAEEALARRRDASIVVETAFEALNGRRPTPAERAGILGRVRAGLALDDLVGELRSGPDGARLLSELAPLAFRSQLERDLAAEREPAAEGTPAASDAAGGAPVRVVFMHIMKTGGTSLSEQLSRWVGPTRARVGVPLDDLVMLPRPVLARLRAVSGHLPYEVLELIPAPFITVSALRDPLLRTLSHYMELRRSEPALSDLSLDEFLTSDEFEVPSGNYQARSLAHTIGLSGAWVEYSPLRRYRQAGGRQPNPAYPLQALFDSTPMLMSEEDLLARASRHLASVDYVGVTEQLGSLAERLSAHFPGRPADLRRLNASEKSAGPRLDELPAAVLRRMDRRTAVDRELYDQAVKLSRA